MDTHCSFQTRIPSNSDAICNINLILIIFKCTLQHYIELTLEQHNVQVNLQMDFLNNKDYTIQAWLNPQLWNQEYRGSNII